MPCCGNRGKPSAGFPPLPRMLGNRNSSDSHIPPPRLQSPIKGKVKAKASFGEGGKVEIRNQDSHFPTVPIRLRRKVKTSSFAPGLIATVVAGESPALAHRAMPPALAHMR
jgi:hypothetical protein